MDKVLFIKEFIDEVWNKKNFEKVGQYIHEEYTIYLDPGDPWEGETLCNSEFKNRMELGSIEPFPDINFEIISAIEEENHVAITWVLTGTNLGEIGDFLPTYRSIKTSGLTIYHFKDNLISGHNQIYDKRNVAEQLGLINRNNLIITTS